MFNPIYIYIYSFSLAIVLYIFNWSTIYPTLSFQTILFFLCSFIVAGYIGFKSEKYNKRYNKSVKYRKSLIYITLLLLGMHILELIYTKQLPIAGIGNYIAYAGIPTLHVIIYTFNIFFSAYLFHVILVEKKKLVPIILFIITVIPSFLILSRGLLVNIAITSLFVMLYTVGGSIQFLKKNLWKLCLVGLIGLYLFGVSGNIRNNTLNQSEDKFDSSYIMDVGGASDFFRNSFIPKEFFWGYLYISSPLANFEKVVQTHTPIMTVENTKTYIVKELVTDFISKRAFAKEFSATQQIETIAPTLTVGTGFRGSYYFLGWIGVTITFIILMGISYIYMRFLSTTNPFRIVGIAMLANLIALFTFDNMIVYSGMSFQLIYPLIWELYIRLEIPIKNMFFKSKDIILAYIKGEKK